MERGQDWKHCQFTAVLKIKVAAEISWHVFHYLHLFTWILHENAFWSAEPRQYSKLSFFAALEVIVFIVNLFSPLWWNQVFLHHISIWLVFFFCN